MQIRKPVVPKKNAFPFFFGKMSLPQTVYFSISNFLYKLTQPTVYCIVYSALSQALYKVQYCVLSRALESEQYSIASHIHTDTNIYFRESRNELTLSGKIKNVAQSINALKYRAR